MRQRINLWFLITLGILTLAACGRSPSDNPPREPESPASISGKVYLPGLGAESNEDSDGTSSIVLSAAAERQSPENSSPLQAGEIIVQYKESSTLAPLSRASEIEVSGLSLEPVAATGQEKVLYRTAGLSAEETLRLVDALKQRPDVESATPNWILEAFRRPNDELYKDFQWNLSALNLERAWELTTGASDVTVAVLDSGSINHPDLRFTGGYDFVSDPGLDGEGNGWDNDPTDPGIGSSYHGAHVAGIIGARTNNRLGIAGTAWNLRLVPVRVLGVDGKGTWFDIEAAIDWAAGRTSSHASGVPANAHPAQVINLSLGMELGQSCRDVLGGSDQYFVNLTRETGTIVVVAAGNKGQDTAGVFPANCPGVITVGATGPENRRASYSNHGAAVDVMAPGGDTTKGFRVGDSDYPYGILSTILHDEGTSTIPAYGFMEGTSMAAPHISGIIALLLSREPTLTYRDVIARLQNSATPVCTEGCGRGLVDALAVLEGSSGTPPPPPPPTADAELHIGVWHCFSSDCSDADIRERPDAVEVMSGFDTSSAGIPYTLLDLSPGTYRAVSWLDYNGNGLPDSNEARAELRTPISLEAGEARRGIDFQLRAPIE